MANTVTSTCSPAIQSPLCYSTDPATRTAAVASTGGAPACLEPPLKSTPIVDNFQQMAAIHKQNNGGLAMGGPVRLAAGGPPAAFCNNPTITPNCGVIFCSYPNPNYNPGSINSSVSSCPSTPPSAGSTGSGGTTPSTPPLTPQQKQQQQLSCAIGGTGSVPTGKVTSCANSKILCTENTNATSPSLTPTTTQSATPIQNSSCQMLCTNKYNVETQPAVTAAQGQAQYACQANPVTAATYCATQIGKAPQMTGAQGQADPNAVVSNQIQQLTQGLNCGKVPAWAQPSVNWANSIMAGRGLGSSSIASQALVTAVQQAALPVAQANAQYYQTLQMANLTNAQQAAVVNQQATVQTLLSNQAAVNAGLQFNATSENQVAQFMTNLSSQINLSNAAQANAMKQFNAGQSNSVSEFNSNLANQVAQFNAQNQLAIDQSNVTWRRNINTLNTAATNAANQTNTQNLFNLTQTAQNNLWNQFQDEASWANTNAQNALTRSQNLVIAAMGQQTLFKLQTTAGQQAFEQMLGQFGIQVAGGFISGALNSSPSITCSANFCPQIASGQAACPNAFFNCPNAG